jgi:hypothetical protein
LLSNRNSLTSILILPKDKTKTKTKQARNPLRLCSTPKEVGMGDWFQQDYCCCKPLLTENLFLQWVVTKWQPKSNSWASEVLPVKDELCRSFSQYHRQASLTTRNIRSVHHLVLFRHPRPSHHLSQTARRKGDTQIGQEIVSKEKNRLLSYKKGPHVFREEWYGS